MKALVASMHIGTVLIAVVLTTIFAHAHSTATGLAQIEVSDGQIVYQLQFALPELPEQSRKILQRAANGDQAAAQQVAESLRTGMLIDISETPCKIGRVQIQGGNDDRIRIHMHFGCIEMFGVMRLRDRWTAFAGKHFRTIATIIVPGGQREFILEDGKREFAMNLARPAPTSWLGFITLGIDHILTGYDHLLFLLAILVGTTSLMAITKIVTAFTIAHSVTLSLATFDLVTLSSGIVEPIIAASIVWVGIENLIWPDARRWRWALAGTFGLIHGLGFASVLKELNLPTYSMAKALVGFNVGVELGQLACILVVVPLLVRLFAEKQQMTISKVSSMIVVVVGGYWFVERTLLL
jgi:hydrogenase/urease accessory protein HupE